MTTLPGRTATALIVIDMQNGVVAEAWQRDDVIGRVEGLVAAAREHGNPVIWVQHSDDDLPEGSHDWELVPALVPADDEPVVRKHYGDAFEGTDLGDLLAGRKVGHVIVCGAESDACVLATLYGAMVRGYDTTLVTDAHTTSDRTEYGGVSAKKTVKVVNLIWAHRTAPGRIARAVPSDEVPYRVPPVGPGARASAPEDVNRLRDELP